MLISTKIFMVLKGLLLLEKLENTVSIEAAQGGWP